MKKINLLLLCGLSIYLLAACQNQQEQSPEEMMSGRKTVLLYGNVNKATCSDGSFVEFNTDGNIVRKKDGGRDYIHEYKYESNNRYVYAADKQAYNIVYSENTRSEVWDNPVEQLSTDYTFDSKGRLTGKSQVDYGWSINVAYEYKGNDLLPYKMVETFSDESGTGTATYLYTYTKVDDKGNWLNCDIEETIDNEIYDYDSDESEKTTEKRSYSLSRNIEYFADDTNDKTSKSEKDETVNEFNWSKKKFPCEIPFKVLNKGNKTFAWEIESIVCKGEAKDKSGYNFVVKGKGAVNSKNYSMGSRSVTFVPEEKNSTSINSKQAAAYIFPSVGEGESFEFEFKGLFPGYYNDKLFNGFLILND